jgi:hypothetical protein
LRDLRFGQQQQDRNTDLWRLFREKQKQRSDVQETDLIGVRNTSVNDISNILEAPPKKKKPQGEIPNVQIPIVLAKVKEFANVPRSVYPLIIFAKRIFLHLFIPEIATFINTKLGIPVSVSHIEKMFTTTWKLFFTIHRNSLNEALYTNTTSLEKMTALSDVNAKNIFAGFELTEQQTTNTSSGSEKEGLKYLLQMWKDVD